MQKRTISRAEAIRDFHDLQGHIVRSNGLPYAVHLLLRFHKSDLTALTIYIEQFARERMRSASDYLSSEEAREAANFFLSAQGYRRLGLEPPKDRSYVGGMKRANLNDPPVAQWEGPYHEEIDAMLVLAYRTPEEGQAAEQIRREISTLAEVFAVEYGHELPGGIEHFGFVDGISQPLFLDEDIEEARALQGEKLLWDPTTDMQQILVRDPYGEGEDAWGSYLVFRKLEQDVETFNANVARLSATLGINNELAAAYIIGRFKDGTPVSLQREPGLGPANNFSYDDDRLGRRCPFGSHIRRVNPRGDLDFATETPDAKNRIARRSLSYGQIGEPTVGMLFMCFQSNINKQFELIQINWANFPDFPRVGLGPDPLIGQRNVWDRSDGHPFPKDWDAPDKARVRLQSCVAMRGGEYFFAPSLTFLRNLRSISQPHSLVIA